jgi:isocitrate dehydrogenase (NAD+)
MLPNPLKYYRHASERICRYGFELARREGRKKVTVGHKANILKFSDGYSWNAGARSPRRIRYSI